ncbi:MAG: hypothetical protein FJ139_08140 [Deltaproteobacteria bacterium]|nr:hypothetical protein [Deltaproteobacteria bacterium]
MDYFRILNLKREPFSNSPEPEFFFHSIKHVGCLQKIELAVRLRRGLSVVTGDVGTGKTTLCRQLILTFSSSEEDKKQIETHLLMDPAFTTPLEFLSTVAMTFGISGAPGGESEWQLKENIKKYLYARGVDEGKIVVLIIDEGQKLPDFCLEILREFLNYETNEYKLLQIVIFAQKEFELTLKRIKNLADRVNIYYFLDPMNFRETRGMVRFRIEKASDSDRAPSLFTYPGLWALYIASGGYPRRIVTLCHQIILTLIIQNRSKAGWFLVRSCARRISPEGRKGLRWVTATALAGVCAAIAIVGFYPDMIFEKMQGKEPPGITGSQNPSPGLHAAQGVQEVKNKAVTEAVAKTPAEGAVPLREMPEIIGRVTLKEGRTVWRMLGDFYGDFGAEHLKAVARTNPHIKNLNKVNAGETIKLPALKVNSNPLPQGKHLVQVASGSDVEEIYELYRKYEEELSNIRFIPYWHGREGIIFSIFLQDDYGSREVALDVLKRLPQPLAVNAKVVDGMEGGTVFFKNR